ncbi:hypothetical protein FOXG_17571 [Fusarium oxysporum f. sp. lycopersici 4287]|uniref:Zn(2)-C6 fungal-type domain-containing protein n=3 Tax=Fusarium oxysporum TaxID=5507 RepID=A0A0J9WD86_FUSO4|nr:uncharacterized protein FOXG_17571 [Fusarium oxysporum f. sp. lycopersici 4287]EXK46278.1 hypothetical protein FOMG_00005 [Fusarium oxysporum f. sp. melonis 26406]KAJ9429876.1 hypothetical protein QL093DRAFT_1074161 [Fusarium oxysporum]KNB20585.1 hypothetical protein FOXG_17571 [Fusarium oxysporum f. sp. lycopersici 4287]
MRPIVPLYPENAALKPPAQPSRRILPPRVKKATRRWERAGKPKSRSGCRTCKIRRVKCDENKPICFRCAKGSFDCDRYSSDAADDSIAPDGFSSGTENSETTDSGASMYTSPETPETNLSTTSTPKPNFCNWPDSPGTSSFCPSSHSVIYLEYFHHHASLNNGVFSYSELFSNIVLQESLQDECMRDSVFAIGSFLLSGFFLSQSSSHMTTVDHHRQASLQFYTTAFTTFRSQMQSSHEVSQKWILLMTLLLVVYELLNGDFDAADGLLSTALEALRPSLTTLPSPPIMYSDMFTYTSIQVMGESEPLFTMASLNTSQPTTQEASLVLFHWENMPLHTGPMRIV